MFQIQLFNKLAATGLAQLDPQHYHVSENSSNPEAILLRSHNLHDYDFSSSICAVGRAGAGTNNIPVDKLTALGIPVLNTPGANANAVKELVLTGMLLAARNICPAWHYAQQLDGDDASLHQQVEAQKKQFLGSELAGKTLGIIGLGAIGVKLANTALALDMEVIGYDPAITVQRAWELSANVKQATSHEEVLSQSDFISYHVPLIEKTKNLCNHASLSQLKPGAVLLNFARAGIVNEQDLLAALDEQQVACYVCDFPSKALNQHPKVISLPHLGASTAEAEENCAIMIVKQLRDFLEYGNIKHSVNFPTAQLPPGSSFRLAITNQNIPNMVGQVTTVLAQAGLNILDLLNKSRQSIAYTLIDIDHPINSSTLQQLQQIEGVIKVRSLPSHKNISI